MWVQYQIPGGNPEPLREKELELMLFNNSLIGDLPMERCNNLVDK